MRNVLAERYDVIISVTDILLYPDDGPFDLCMIDNASLAIHHQWLSTVRRNYDPLYLPVLMIAERSETGRIPKAFWAIADDILMRPLDRTELITRVQSMLRTRAMSVRAHRTFGMYEQEARIAQRLQAAAVPNAFPSVPNMHFDGYYRPADVQAQVGGDWYDVLRLLDGRVVVSIGDVAGSGLDAAVTMGKLRQVVRAVAQVSVDPAVILEAADLTLQADEPGRYVTAFVGVIDGIGGRLTYASAGHPLPVIRQPDGNLAQLARAGILLGTGIPVERRTHVAACNPGTVLTLFTDGLTEATRDVIEGQTRVEQAVRELDFTLEPNPAQAIFHRVIHEAANDDTAILTVTMLQTPGHAAIGIHRLDSSQSARVREIQGEITAVLRAKNYDDDAIAGAELAFIELIGNTVRYAPGEIMVVLDTSGPAAVLHILDRGPGFDYAPSELVESNRESGRGLYIIQHLVQSLTINARIGGGSHARAVLHRHGKN